MTTRFNVCIFDPSQKGILPVYDEAAMSVFYGLQALGLDVVMRDNRLHRNRINIVFGMNQYDPLFHPSLKDHKIVIFNLEQMERGGVCSNVVNAGFRTLVQGHPVWDYSSRNVDFFNVVWQIAHVQHVELGYAPELSRIKTLLPYTQISNEAKTHDVAFFGSVNPRRQHILDALSAAGLSVNVLSGFYGEHRDAQIARATLVINISFYEDAILEMARLGYLFTNGIPVVSEISTQSAQEIDPDLYNALQPVLLDDLVARCIELVNDAEKRSDLATRCAEYYTAEQRSMSCHLHKALVGLQKSPLCSDWCIVLPPESFQDIPLTERAQANHWMWPQTLNIGSGREYNPLWVNADISWQWEPDWLVDLAQPLVYHGIDIPLGAHGRHRLRPGMFSTIKASEVLEHVSDAVVFMTNCLDLLAEGGALNITVPYDLSYGAWQDPTHVRAFNERSFWYYCDWHWYLGWMTHRFDTVEMVYSLSALGHETIAKTGITLEEVARIPRAVDHLHVKLIKRALTTDEIAHARSLQLCQR